MTPLHFAAIGALWRLRRRVIQRFPGERAPFARVAHLLEIALLERPFFISHRLILRAAYGQPLSASEAANVLAGLEAYASRGVRLVPYMFADARAA